MGRRGTETAVGGGVGIVRRTVVAGGAVWAAVQAASRQKIIRKIITLIHITYSPTSWVALF
jgi:hypothetical protein